MLFGQACNIEIVPPFIERLSLFAHDTRALRVAVGASGRSSHRGISNAFMRRGRAVRAADLAVRRHMATGAGNPNRFPAECTRNGLRDDGRVDVGQGERFGEVADITGCAPILRLAGANGPWVDTS